MDNPDREEALKMARELLRFCKEAFGADVVPEAAFADRLLEARALEAERAADDPERYSRDHLYDRAAKLRSQKQS